MKGVRSAFALCTKFEVDAAGACESQVLLRIISMPCGLLIDCGPREAGKRAAVGFHLCSRV
jgi:hypothetical protein